MTRAKNRFFKSRSARVADLSKIFIPDPIVFMMSLDLKEPHSFFKACCLIVSQDL